MAKGRDKRRRQAKKLIKKGIDPKAVRKVKRERQRKRKGDEEG